MAFDTTDCQVCGGPPEALKHDLDYPDYHTYVPPATLAHRRAWAEAGCPAPTYGGSKVTTRGRVRLYFNRHQDAPRVWCLSDLDCNWEIQLAHVTVQAPLETVYEPLAHARDSHEGPPTAYQVSVGDVLVEVTGHSAVILPLPTSPTQEP